MGELEQLLQQVQQVDTVRFVLFAIVLALFVFLAISRAGIKTSNSLSDILVKFAGMVGDGQKERVALEERSTNLAQQLILLNEQMKEMLEQQIAAQKETSRVMEQFVKHIAEIPQIVPQAEKMHEETRALVKGYAAGVETHMDEIEGNGEKLMEIIRTIQADLVTIKNKVDATDNAVLTAMETIKTQLDELVKKTTSEQPVVKPPEKGQAE